MKPLAGIRVADFTHAISGPTCTMTLAQLGAEVIKVEPPQVGDDFRHYTEHAGLPGMSVPFAAVNAGKRSITLNLKSAGGLAAARKLCGTADIVAENYRPGVIARLGLGYDVLSAARPELIMVSLSGFGQSGPMRDWGAYDHIAQAVSGMAAMNATKDGPLKIGIPVVDSFSGYLAAIGVLAALRVRDATGQGQWLDVAMLDAALKMMGTAPSVWSYTGESPQGTGNRGFRLVATAEFYATGNGWIALGANHQHQIEGLFRTIRHPELLQDPRFADHHARVANYAALKAWLTSYLLTRDAAELEAELTQAGVPAAMIRNVGQIMQHPHLATRGLLEDVTLPGHERPLATLGPGFAVERDEARPAVPSLGAETDAVLAELGYSAAEIVQMRSDGAI